jgi:hypothetical protein
MQSTIVHFKSCSLGFISYNIVRFIVNLYVAILPSLKYLKTRNEIFLCCTVHAEITELHSLPYMYYTSAMLNH